MTNFGMGTRLAALALALTIGTGSAIAGSEKVDTTAAAPAKTASVLTSVEVSKGGTVITHQTVDGIDYRVEWSVPANWVDASTGTIAKGWLAQAVDFVVGLIKTTKPDDGGGSSNTCNVSVSGATVVVIGNLNCGGSQVGTSGSGSGAGGGGGSGSGNHSQ